MSRVACVELVFSTPWRLRYVDPSPDVEDKSLVPVWNQTTIHLSSAPYWSHRPRRSRLLVGLAGSSVSEPKVLTTDHYMIPARNAIHARAQDFVVSDGLLLPIHKAFAQRTPSQHAARNEWCLELMYTTANIHRSYYNSPAVLLQPAGTLTAPDTPHFPRSRGLYLVAGATGRGTEQVFAH